GPDHSFIFGFRPDITAERTKRIRPRDKEIYKYLEVVVIDEISMVRADLLDCVDIFLRRFGPTRRRPFGGVQMIFIGDLYQLSPVVTSKEKGLFTDFYESPYFFDSRVFRGNFWTKQGSLISRSMEFFELQKVYRQKEEKFLSLLNAIRNNTATFEHMQKINQQLSPGFIEAPDDLYIHLTTTNALAEGINKAKLEDLKAEPYLYKGTVKGDFEIKALPTLPELCLKEYAQVMLLNNDSYGRWINGSVGRILGFESVADSPDIIRIALNNGGVVDVAPFKWEMFEFKYDSDEKTIITESTGSFTQYPVKLAWAVTIHKSQGMTFDKLILDIGRGTFSHGQLYVALSRCTTLKGIVLRKPVNKHNILMDKRVINFITSFQK
ncbi:MAG: AAA family ATPase, partial [Candidatus Mariimomonas ferrooxydans]